MGSKKEAADEVSEGFQTCAVAVRICCLSTSGISCLPRRSWREKKVTAGEYSAKGGSGIIWDEKKTAEIMAEWSTTNHVAMRSELCRPKVRSNNKTREREETRERQCWLSKRQQVCTWPHYRDYREKAASVWLAGTSRHCCPAPVFANYNLVDVICCHADHIAVNSACMYFERPICLGLVAARRCRHVGHRKIKF